MKILVSRPRPGAILIISLAVTCQAFANVSITISGLAQSTTGPFTSGDPISLSLTVDPGTIDSWSAGSPPGSPSQWSNAYPENSIVIGSVASASLLNGPIQADSTTMPSANLQIWDETVDRFSIGATLGFFAADLGGSWYLTGMSFETTGLPLNYVDSYTDPASWLAGAAGTYTSGLENSFLFISVWNGFQSGLSVSVDQITVVPEPSLAVLATGLAGLGLLAWRRKRRCVYFHAKGSH